MQFSNIFLIAIATAGFASAADICPPTYCEVGQRCDEQPSGSHCCAGNNKDVLQCTGGAWSILNTCAEADFCECTGSDDLVCKNSAKKLARNL